MKRRKSIPSTPEKPGPRLAWIASVGWWLFALLPILPISYLAYRAKQIEAWPTAPGRIVRADLHESRSPGAKQRTQYEAIVEYTYEVDGLEYRGDQIAFCYQSGSDPRRHIEFLQKLRSGSTVMVHYSPYAPGDAYLVGGITIDVLYWLILGAWWLGLFVLVTYGVRWSGERDESLFDHILTGKHLS